MSFRFSSPNLRIIFLAFLVIPILFFENCNDNPYKQGKILYEMYCQNCHQPNGEGLAQLIPPIAKSDYLFQHRTELPCIIRKGLKGNMVVNNITYGQQQMLPINKFSDAELANLLNFIDSNWGNNGKLWTADEISGYSKDCPPFQ